MINKNKNYNYHLTHFMTSVSFINNLPKDKGIEIAFVGYSNSGKSSVLNVLTNQKKLARTSKRLGCTQLINLFEVKNGYRLVDLPGYGYANLSKKIKIKLKNILNQYLKTRNCLKGLVLLMDIRYPLKIFDQNIIKWATYVNIPILILLNKADKISLHMQKIQLNIVQKTIISFIGDIQVEIFSVPKKIGINKLNETLNIWFNKI